MELCFLLKSNAAYPQFLNWCNFFFIYPYIFRFMPFFSFSHSKQGIELFCGEMYAWNMLGLVSAITPRENNPLLNRSLDMNSYDDDICP